MTKHTQYRKLDNDPIYDYILQLDSDNVFLDQIIIDNGVEVFNHQDQSGVFTSDVMHQAYEIELDKFALVFERYYTGQGSDWTCISENFYIAGCSTAAKQYLTQLLETV